MKIAKLDDATYGLLKASPEAIELRFSAIEWKMASDKDGVDHPPGCRHERDAERAHRRLMEAAYQYGIAVHARITGRQGTKP